MSRDLSKPIQEELEKFFIATDELEDKKLEIIGWKGPKIATEGDQGRRQDICEEGAVIPKTNLHRYQYSESNQPWLAFAGRRSFG